MGINRPYENWVRFDMSSHSIQVSNRTRKPELLLAVLVLLCSIYVLPRWADWNVNSRMNVALAVVDRGTWQIDDYYKNTGDYAYFEGHFYSDKAPGTSFVAIPLYAIFEKLGARGLTDALTTRLAHNPAFATTLDPNGKGMLAESVYEYAAQVWVTFFIVTIPSVLMAILLFRLVNLWLDDRFAAFFIALTYSVATPALTYANNLYGHQPAAFLLTAAFYLLYQSGRGRRIVPYALLAGFALGAVVVTEYQTALIAGGLGLYALYKLRNWKLLFGMGLAALPPVALAAWYNLVIFHTPLPVGYLFSPLYTDLHRIGLISLTYPKLDALAELMFGSERGLFLISPLLLLAVPGFVWFARVKQLRAEFYVCLWSVISFWLFNSSSAMWQGGFAVGPRYLLPMLPFMALPIAFVLPHAHALWARLGIGLLTLWSILGVWILTLGGQEFPQYQRNPWVEYSIPQLLAGNVARNLGMLVNLRGLASLLPLAVCVAGLALLYLWQMRKTEGQAITAPLAGPRVVSR